MPSNLTKILLLITFKNLVEPYKIWNKPFLVSPYLFLVCNKFWMK